MTGPPPLALNRKGSLLEKRKSFLLDPIANTEQKESNLLTVEISRSRARSEINNWARSNELEDSPQHSLAAGQYDLPIRDALFFNTNDESG